MISLATRTTDSARRRSIETVLLVEDNPGDARLLREMCKEPGPHSVNVTHVECMCKAEARLVESRFDVVLLDLGLPDVQGLAAVRRARAAAPHIPLVVLTGLDDESLAVQALQAGAQDYLVKGQIETRGLLRSLRYAVERKVLQDRHGSLMEHANDAILLLLPDLRIAEANRRAEELLGCPREQMVGQSYEDFVAPEDRGLLATDFTTLLAEGAARGQDRWLRRTDGTVVSVDLSASLILSGDEPVVLAILHDTTLRQRSERELGAARNILHRLVSENPAVIYSLRVEAEAASLAWISENVGRLLGCTVEEALAPGWWNAGLHPEDSARIRADVGSVFLHERLTQEYRFRHSDGTFVWLRDERRVLRDPGGEPREIVGSLSDVSARKDAEQRLLESEEEYRLLFDSNPHPMWVFEVETLNFLAVNEAAVRLYGFSREEFLAMTIQEIQASEGIPAMLESVAAAALKHRKRDGSSLEVTGASNPIEFHGRRARLVLVDDVSERRRLEAELVQAQKMEAVGRLAGGIAHDFNNLLGVISGYSELLLDDLAPETQATKRVEEIQKAAQRAAGLTRQLLAFSRKQVLQPRVLDLNEVVAEVGKMLRRLIGEDIEMRVKAGAGLGRIRADPGQLEQVLMNLVVNARDAMPRGGSIILETANTTLDASYARAHPEITAGAFVMLSVTDTGEGMDTATQAHLFEPFFTTKEEGKGTGLGLATVFGIVQQSGGSISVSSRLGFGTAFRIHFPRVEDELAEVAPGGRRMPAPGGTESLLLVEDAGPLREMIREILEAAGYRVLASAGPADALRGLAAIDAPPDLLLTDVVMPGMSGPELARNVRLARPETKVLFMSGYTDDAVGLHGVLSSETRFLQKPFTSDALLLKVRETLDQP